MTTAVGPTDRIYRQNLPCCAHDSIRNPIYIGRCGCYETVVTACPFVVYCTLLYTSLMAFKSLAHGAVWIGSRLGCLHLEDGGSSLLRRAAIYQSTRCCITEDANLITLATGT